MMFKKTMALLILLLLSLFVCTAEAEENHVLLIRNVQNGSVLSDCVEQILRYSVFGNWLCDYASTTDEITITDYDAFILCTEPGSELMPDIAEALRTGNKPVLVIGEGCLAQLIPTETRSGTVIISENDQTDGGTLLVQTEILLPEHTDRVYGGTLYVNREAYPLCASSGHVTHLAAYTGNGMDVFLVNMIQSWLWPYRNAPTTYAQYLVLDEVYPFADLQRLMEISEMLEEEDAPYAVCVMPVYSNADYPSMKHFCECLRYIQSRGAGIILHVPLISPDNTDSEEVKAAIATAYSAYSMYGVYPVALEAPESFLYSENGLEILAGFRTVFLTESQGTSLQYQNSENIAHRYGMQLIGPAWEREEQVTGAVAQAVYLNAEENVEELRRQIRRLKASRRVFKNLNDLENVAYVGADYISRNSATGLMVNNTLINLAYIPFEYEEYHYERGFVQILTEQIATSNSFIMIFVVVCCTFFITGIILSRRLTRRQLLRGERLRSWQTPEEQAAESDKETKL